MSAPVPAAAIARARQLRFLGGRTPRGTQRTRAWDVVAMLLEREGLGTYHQYEIARAVNATLAEEARAERKGPP